MRIYKICIPSGVKKIALFVGLFTVVFFLSASPIVQAHQSSISVDSEKSMVMHVEPNHYPVAGRDNRIIFFYDKAKWDANESNSVASLQVTHSSGETKGEDAIFADGSITTSHKFLEDGLYNMELVVARNDSNNVDRFRFDVETIQETNQQKERRRARTVQIIGSYSLVGLSLILLLYYGLRFRKDRR